MWAVTEPQKSGMQYSDFRGLAIKVCHTVLWTSTVSLVEEMITCWKHQIIERNVTEMAGYC